MSFIASVLLRTLLCSGFFFCLIVFLYRDTLRYAVIDLRSQALQFSACKIEHGKSKHVQPQKQAIYTFDTIPELQDLTPAGSAAWSQKVLTPGGGFLRVSYNETYERTWGISMFHSLHCLQFIREELVNARLERTGKNTQEPGSHHDHSHGGSEKSAHHSHALSGHIGHCFAYIAQSLACAADGTIEPPQDVFDAEGNILISIVDGEGYQHQCKDASPLWAAALRSEERPWKEWGWHAGDTIESVFESLL